MLKVNMTIYDGCEWTHVTITKEFKNKKELNKFIDICASAMDRVSINYIEKIK